MAKKQLNVRVESTVSELVDELAGSQGISKAEIIERAIKAYAASPLASELLATDSTFASSEIATVLAKFEDIQSRFEQMETIYTQMQEVYVRLGKLENSQKPVTAEPEPVTRGAAVLPSPTAKGERGRSTQDKPTCPDCGSSQVRSNGPARDKAGQIISFKWLCRNKGCPTKVFRTYPPKAEG